MLELYENYDCHMALVHRGHPHSVSVLSACPGMRRIGFFLALQIPLFLVPSYHVNLAAHKLRHGRVDVSEIGRHRHMQDLNIPQSEEVDPAVTKAMFGARIFLRLLWLGIDGHLVRSQWIVMEQDV